MGHALSQNEAEFVLFAAEDDSSNVENAFMMSVRKYCMYLSSSSTRSQHWNINIEPLYLDYMRPLCSERAQMELATAVNESIHGSHSPHELHG